MAISMTQVAPILFGVGAVKELGVRINELGCKKVLCVTDKGVQAAGILDKVTQSLKDARLDFVCFDDCKADPPDNVIDNVAEIARREAIDCIVGVGGGSSLDTAKAVSIVIKNNVPILSLVNTPPRASDVPLILIPTTSGTGSEVTVVSVITDSKTGLKTGVVLTDVMLALVDPELTIGVPPAITAMTGMDVVAHAAEALTSSQKNPLSDIHAIAALERVGRYLPIAVKDGKNIEARSNMCLASTLAGMAFNDAMVTLGHGIAHALGSAMHLPHGLACALATPPTMECFAAVVPESVAAIGRALGAKIENGAPNAEIGKITADQVRALMKEIGIQSFREQGFSREDVVSKVNNVMAEMLIYLSPLSITPEIVEKVLASMYDDYE